MLIFFSYGGKYEEALIKALLIKKYMFLNKGLKYLKSFLSHILHLTFRQLDKKQEKFNLSEKFHYIKQIFFFNDKAR